MNDKVFSIIFIIILTITNIIAVILVTGILLVVVALILAKVKPDAMAFSIAWPTSSFLVTRMARQPSPSATLQKSTRSESTVWEYLWP